MLGVGLGLTTVRGRAAAFVPTDLADLVLWLDASDTATITESGGAVSQWDDKSGNGYDATQASAALQPATGATTINGLNVLDFNGDFLVRSQQLFTTAITGYAVVSFGNNTSRYNVVDFGNLASAGNRSFLLEQNTILTAGSRYGFYASNSGFDSATATSSGVKILGVRATATGNIIANTDYRVNGSSSALTLTAGGGTYGDYSAISGFGIGAINNGGSPLGTMVGSIGEIIAFDRQLNLSETSLLENYLAGKWGVTLA